MQPSAVIDQLERLRATVTRLDDAELRANFTRLSELLDSGWKDLYIRLETPAKYVKTAIQMLIGVSAVVLLLILVVPPLLAGDFPDDTEVLKLVGRALALAAAIELAYTLFTDGPDEAIDPLMLGLSAAVLLQLAGVTKLQPSDAGAVAIYAVSLGVLFFVRQKFIDGSRPPRISGRDHPHTS